MKAHVICLVVCLLCGELSHWTLFGVVTPRLGILVYGGKLPMAAHGSDHNLMKSYAFLKDKYKVKGENTEYSVRQVPGDGGCLFHAISACLSFVQTRTHCEFDWRMRKLSQVLRHLAVDILQSPNVALAIENGEITEATSLLKTISDVYNIEPEEYCKQILDPRTWGGGPEIVALSNHFKCPIHVYQLCTDKNVFTPFKKAKFQLQMCAKFGSPTYDSKSPLRILCADGRFPAVAPGQHKPVGDHFLALFPTDIVPSVSGHASEPVRGGALPTSSILSAAHAADKVDRAQSAPATTGVWPPTSITTQLMNGVRRVFNMTMPREETSGAVHKHQSVQCLLSDCPVMYADSAFREWYPRNE